MSLEFKKSPVLIVDSIRRAYFNHVGFQCIHDDKGTNRFCDSCPIVHLAKRENTDISYYCDYVKKFENDDDSDCFKIHIRHPEAKIEENCPGFNLYSCENKEIYKSGIYPVSTGLTLEMAKKFMVIFYPCRENFDIFECINEPLGYIYNNRTLHISVKAFKNYKIVPGDKIARMVIVNGFPENKVVRCHHA